MRLEVIYCCILYLFSFVILPLYCKIPYKVLSVKIMPPGNHVGKIVGGSPVPIEKFPSAALVFNLGSLCSGTILNSWTTLSAAHCFDHSREIHYITVHVGARHRRDYKAEVHNVASVKIHEDYNKAMPFACDIALIFVEVPFDFRKNVQKAVLVGNDTWMSEQEKEFHVTGWGFIKYAGELSQVGLLLTTMQFMPRDKCGKMHNLDLSPDMFCLYGDGIRDSCTGDSGGGVMWNGLLVGVVSHGDGCALKNKPSMYSNVYYFRSWIRDNIQAYFDNHCRDQKRRNKQRRTRRRRNITGIDIL